MGSGAQRVIEKKIVSHGCSAMGCGARRKIETNIVSHGFSAVGSPIRMGLPVRTHTGHIRPISKGKTPPGPGGKNIGFTLPRENIFPLPGRNSVRVILSA